MELAKYKKFLKEDNYTHCTICGNYRNINSFAHRKSEAHQKRLSVRLHKVSFHLSQKKEKPIVIHDEHWPDRDYRRLCHFCGDTYAEHHVDDEFVIESLGSIYHHANSQHSEAVKTFLKQNYRKESYEKFCIQKEYLDGYLKRIPEVKNKYLKKMDILNDMILKQIRDSEEKRKKLIADELKTKSSCNSEMEIVESISESSGENQPKCFMAQSSSDYEIQKFTYSHQSSSGNNNPQFFMPSSSSAYGIQNFTCSNEGNSAENNSQFSMAQSSSDCGIQKFTSSNQDNSGNNNPQFSRLKHEENKDFIKVPPWLQDIPDESSMPENQSVGPVYGPTIDTLMKHVASQKKKGLSKHRIGANFKHHVQGSSKWLPSFQGVWNQGRRKQLKYQFKRRNKKHKFK